MPSPRRVGSRAPAARLSLVLAVAAWGQCLPAQEPLVFRPNALRHFMGTNLNWVYDGDGLDLSRPEQPIGVADSLIRRLGYTAVRIPGGTVARRFPWRAAVGELRGRDADFSGVSQPISTGLPEFKRFAARYGLRVLYIVNINDAPGEVAELVRSWNALEPRDAQLQYVELGNEDYIYDGGPPGAERYAARVLPIIRALRAAFPEVRIGAQLANPLGTGWDEVVYRRLSEEADFWTWHRYLPYTSYDAASSYEATVESTLTLDRDFVRREQLQTGRRLPLWLTEFNFMFYRNGRYENVALEPRYYLLLGNLLHSGVRHGLAAAFKCCLVNPWFQALVDIDSARSNIGMTLSGEVAALLNGWIARQDSLAVPPELDAGGRVNLLMGKDSAGSVSFLVQNHAPEERLVPLPVSDSDSWVSSDGLFQDGVHFGVSRPRAVRRGTRFEVRVPPYSITTVRFSGTAR